MTVLLDIPFCSYYGRRMNLRYLPAAARYMTFDPQTAQFQAWIIPAGGGVVRNMMRTADGNLVLAESGLNRVALLHITSLVASPR